MFVANTRRLRVILDEWREHSQSEQGPVEIAILASTAVIHSETLWPH